MDSLSTSPLWMTWALMAPAFYNFLWGAWAVLFPNAYFDWAGMQRPIYPEIWQCVGMLVGVYGVGYAIAAFDPFRHWPIVLVGLMGKVLGPIGFAQASGRWHVNSRNTFGIKGADYQLASCATCR
jgi:hypothetical protein